VIVANLTHTSAIGRLCEKCDGKWCAKQYYYLCYQLIHGDLVPSVIHTYDLKHSSGYVTSAILVHMEEDVLSVDHQVRYNYSCVYNIDQTDSRRYIRCVLLRRVHAVRKRQRRMSEDRELGC
jgi:hypothetical protein